MQSLQDLQDKLFFECKSILEGVSKINTPEELLVKHDILIELTDRINILKYLEKNKGVFENNNSVDPISAIAEVSISELENEDLVEEMVNSEIEEEVLFTNELNDFEDDLNFENSLNEIEEIIPEDIENQFVDELIEEELQHDEDLEEDLLIESEIDEQFENIDIPEEVEDQLVDEIVEEELINLNNEIEITEDFSDSDNELNLNSGNQQEFSNEEIIIPEFEKPKEVDQMFAFAMDNSSEFNAKETTVENENQQSLSEQETSNKIESTIETSVQEIVDEKKSLQERAEHQDKKFKLSNIKGVKAIQSLFDEEMFETPQTSTINSNNTTQEKSKNDFKLDLNDKIAFTKTLFAGSQADLNDSIRIINECQDLEEAKEYLSDLYYDRNWSKVDDYAQRLWSLVENKFG